MASLAARSDLRRAVIAQRRLTVPESCQVLVDGFIHGFQTRKFPSSLSGVSFIRIAGQAVNLEHDNSRSEVKRVLDSIKPGGAFLVLGHGGELPCGAVAAKKKAIELGREGEVLQEDENIVKLVEQVCPNVDGKASPEGERINTEFQAQKVLNDPEFGAIIRKKNITVVMATLIDEQQLYYNVMNRPEWNGNGAGNGEKNRRIEEKLQERHPKLVALRAQMAKGMAKVKEDGINIAWHYAHSIMVYDPVKMRAILDPLETYLDIGGVCCVDARLKPNTPDSPKYLYRAAPNTMFAVTVGTKNGNGVSFSYDDMGSVIYALRHVNGVDSLKEGGEKGNGHIVCQDTNISGAMKIKIGLLENGKIREATGEGKTITVAAFDGNSLVIQNEFLGVDINVPYRPEGVNLLGV